LSTPWVFELDNVSYNYPPAQTALANINLRVAYGEKLVLLGPNGCGKSTLQKVLAGLILATGDFCAFGREITPQLLADPDAAAVYRRQVGFVFQNSEVQIFCASVFDEIMFGPLALGLSYDAARERVNELMAFIGIEHLANCLPHHMSGGEKKKVAFAAVLAVNPAVIILDEPTNGLDPRTQRWLLDTLVSLHQQGKTIITATHQLELVPELAERIIVFGENHQIIGTGTPQEVLTDRKLLLAANLIDERYHVHIHGEDGHVHVHQHRAN
jgi:cobalt/nickel transport system ATP-binding protein